MKAAIIIIAVVVVLAVIFIAIYNSLVKKKNTVDEAFSTMDVYMKKRWDLIPNLVASVKGYAAHEANTLQSVIAARGSNYAALSDEEKIKANTELSKAMVGINALAENYPELKANQNFLDLNRQLEKVEEDIANSRKYYNATVKEFNTKIEMFPSNIIASMFKFQKRTMFLVENEQERNNVKVEF